MPYVEGQTIHDADSHVMELPGTINPYIDPKFRDRFVELAGPKAILPEWSEKIQAMQDDAEFRAGDEANLLLRKNYQALGAFRREDGQDEIYPPETQAAHLQRKFPLVLSRR